jgi:branched-chain amino acid transport system permease protein
MEALAEATINGLLMGSLYSLIAVGLSLVFGVMKVVNFAHGSLLTVGMYAVYYMVVMAKWNSYITPLVVLPLLFLFGYLIQSRIINPVLKREFQMGGGHAVILLTVGLMLFLENLCLLFFGAYYKVAQMPISGMTLPVGDALVSVPRLIAGLISVAAIFSLRAFLNKTDLGKAIRATGQDRDAVKLMGINDFKIYNIAFGICFVMLGIASALMIPMYYVHPSAGKVFEMRSFVIVVLGGLGSLDGAFLGGIIIGLIESVSAQFLPATTAEFLIFFIFILVLLLKPNGLLGKK